MITKIGTRISNKLGDTISKVDFLYIVALSAFFILFVLVWSIVSLSQLYNIRSAILDLGVAAERLWLPLNSSETVRGILYNVFYGSIIPYILSPLSFLNNMFPAMLILQTIFIWASVFPIYFIARKFNLSTTVSLLISLSYFFYFPLSGLNFFDFHMQAFFPFLFLMAYALYKYNYVKSAVLFFAIAALAKFPYAIFIAMFALIELISYFYEKRRGDHYKIPLLPIFFLLIFSVGSLIAGEVLSLAGPHGHVGGKVAGGIFPLGSIAITIFIIFGSVLFVNFYSKRWFLFPLVFVSLMVYTHSGAYMFPGILTDQYSASFAPFIFLGVVEGISSFSKDERSQHGEIYYVKNVKKKFRLDGTKRVVLTILVILILMSLIFEPWSPIVKDNNLVNYYGNANNPYDSFQTYQYLTIEDSMIPRNNPYVLVPNNIPEAYPRALPGGQYKIGELIMGFPRAVFEPVTLSDAVNDTFPYIAWNGTVVNIPIDYAWATLFDQDPFSDSGTQSLVDIMNIMLMSGEYGIMAEANGTLVIERNYSYPPALYVPLNNFVGATKGNSNSPHELFNGSFIFNGTPPGSILWYGGTSFYPGTYNSSLHFAALPGSYGNISVTEILNGRAVAEKYVNISGNGNHLSSINVSFSQIFTQIEANGYCYFIVRSNGWSGHIIFNGLTVKEVSYQW